VHWQLGQVVDDVQAGLKNALEQAFSSQAVFLDFQQKAFAYTFYSNPQSTAAQRGADAISSFLRG